MFFHTYSRQGPQADLPRKLPARHPGRRWNQRASFTLHGLFSHVPQTTPIGNECVKPEPVLRGWANWLHFGGRERLPLW